MVKYTKSKEKWYLTDNNGFEMSISRKFNLKQAYYLFLLGKEGYFVKELSDKEKQKIEETIKELSDE